MYTLKSDPYSSHQKLCAIIRDSVASGKILDVGCSEGLVGRGLAGSDYELYGIDKDAAALENARPFYSEVFRLDIAGGELPPGSEFDAIVFADVLEHVADPNGVLRRFRPLLKDSGLLLISLPNVANWYVRLNLLLGRFDYSDRGIMDRTHLRFFTLRTAKRLLEDSGFSVVKLTATPPPLPEVWSMTAPSRPLYFLHVLSNIVTTAWKSLFAYQFLLIAKKRPYD